MKIKYSELALFKSTNQNFYFNFTFFITFRKLNLQILFYKYYKLNRFNLCLRYSNQLQFL